MSFVYESKFVHFYIARLAIWKSLRRTRLYMWRPEQEGTVRLILCLWFFFKLSPILSLAVRYIKVDAYSSISKKEHWNIFIRLIVMTFWILKKFKRDSLRFFLKWPSVPSGVRRLIWFTIKFVAGSVTVTRYQLSITIPVIVGTSSADRVQKYAIRILSLLISITYRTQQCFKREVDNWQLV